MTDIKAIALKSPRRVAVAVALIIILIGLVMTVRALFLWRASAETGAVFDDGILTPLLSVVPEGSRPLASIAVWIMVVVTTVPMFGRNAVLVGAVAARAESDHALLWVPLSVRFRPSRGLRVERGETLVVTHRASKRGLFNQNEKNSVKFTAPAGTLFSELETTPDQFSVAGLIESARISGVKLEFRDTAKGFDGAPE